MRIAADIRQFCGRQTGLLLGRVIAEPPHRQPGCTEHAGEQECRLPAPGCGNQRHQQRGDNGPDIGAGIEDAGGQRTLTAREPFGYRLERCRKIARFAKAQEKPRNRKPHHAGGQGMPHRRQAPEADRQRIAEPRAEAVDHRTAAQQTQRIRRLECGDDIAVLDFVPTDLRLQERRQHAQYLAIHIVDGGGGQQQGANPPAHPAEPCRCSLRRCGGHVAHARGLCNRASAPAAWLMWCMHASIRCRPDPSLPCSSVRFIDHCTCTKVALRHG